MQISVRGEEGLIAWNLGALKLEPPLLEEDGQRECLGNVHVSYMKLLPPPTPTQCHFLMAVQEGPRGEEDIQMGD